AEELAVDPGEGEEVLLHLGRDALGQRISDRVREAERQVELVAGDLGLVADAVDLELALETLGHALDHVVDEGADEAVAGADRRLVAGAGHADRGLLDLDLHALRDGLLELTLRPLHRDDGVLQRDLHAAGDGDGLFADARHGYQTSQMTSPPTFSLRAWRSVMRPLEVETTAVPSPPRTLGRRVAGT